MLCFLAVVLAAGFTCSSAQQLPGGGFLAVARPGAFSKPGYNIPIRVPLPELPVLTGSAEFHFTATEITGPGDNSSVTDPYLLYTGRTYNDTMVAGVIRIKQGESMRYRLCNDLDPMPYTLDPDQTNSYDVEQGPSTDAGNNYKTDPNLYANHLHGIYGNPGTNNIPCDYVDPEVPCFRGDNIFENIATGSCVDYQIDVPSVHALGTLWMHPHHHGSGSIQTQTASVPAMIDYNPGVGFDYYNTTSCQDFRQYIYADNEIILHMQTFLMSVNYDGLGVGSGPGGMTGPTDDGYIEISTTMVPQDPYCCAGPDPDTDDDAVPGETTWIDVGDPEGAGNETGPSISVQQFYTSGQNGQFTIINGAYQPLIEMTANRAYRWRMVQAATMKWMDVSIAEPGCQMGLYGRDGNPLYSAPRITDHVAMNAANRAEMFVSCEPGNYTLRTGYGPLYTEEGCQSTHCELLVQEVLATIVVTEDGNTNAPETGDLFSMNCQPAYPPYLQSLQDQSAYKRDSLATRFGLLNFTDPSPSDTPESGACSINGALYTQQNAIQEELGAVHQLDLDNIDVHSFHHHVQPYQIVSLGGHAPDNGSWQVGDWADVLTRFDNVSTAEVRWLPGPYEITGTGFAVVHCHLLPHNDEGCMMRFQLLQSTPASVVQPPGKSQAYKAGVTLAGIISFFIVFGGIWVMLRRRKARRARAMGLALASPLVIPGAEVVDPEAQTSKPSDTDLSEDVLVGDAPKPAHAHAF